MNMKAAERPAAEVARRRSARSAFVRFSQTGLERVRREP